MKYLNYEAAEKNINETMAADLASAVIGGAAVAVCQEREDGKKTVFTACYGKRNTVTDEDMTPDTLFRLASMTKPITAAAILLQIQRGKLRLNSPVSDFLPAFGEMSVGRLEGKTVVPDHKLRSPLTVLHLLTHTNGLLTGDPICTSQPPVPPEVRKDLATAVDYFGTHELLACEPMGKAAYSSTAAFDVAARIVEITSGLSFAEFLRENLFVPLDMPDTSFSPTEEAWARMTAMHDRRDGKNAVADMGDHTFSDFPLSYTSGGASLTSTLTDYTHFAEMLLHEGSFRGREILKPEMISLMRTPWVPQDLPGNARTETWGLGVRVITNDPVLPRGAFGWSGAYGTHFWIDPVNRLYAVYLKNSWYDGGSGAKTARVFEQCVMNALSE